MAKRNIDPIIRVAPLGELRIYAVSEEELDRLSQGGPASILLNFALALLPMSAGLYVTLAAGVERHGIYIFCFATIAAIAGLICMGVWWPSRRQTSLLLQRFKSRMEPPEGIAAESASS